MRIVRCIALLFLITQLGHGQVLQEHNLAEIPVRQLYRQLVSQPVGGIPSPERMKVVSPYLSTSLRNRIAQTRACSYDWFHKHSGHNVKPPFAWGEFGLFSGADDRSGFSKFEIEKTEVEGDSVHVYLRLTGGNPQEKLWNWQVVDVVVREGARYAIDDVIFLKDKDIDTEWRLSGILAVGCDGSHWVGVNKGTNN